MTAAWEVIDSQTLGSAAASVTFSSIPQGYRDLVLVVDANHTGANNSRVRVNSDTGANYHRVGMVGTALVVASFSSTGVTSWQFGAIGKSQQILQILDYTATDKHKTALLRGGAAVGTASEEVIAIAYRWANTAAITALEIDPDGTYDAGSTFTLYGSNRA